MFKSILFSILIFGILACESPKKMKPQFAFVIHGGAGTILKEKMTPEKEAAIRAAMEKALQAGFDILKNNGSSLDAVQAAIVILEDSPEFNAGKGAVFTHDGTNELDASMMDGKTLAVGAATGIKHVKNPIKLARAVLDSSVHVFLSGAGADEFAREQGLEMVENDYFYTKSRWESLQKVLKQEKAAVAEFPDSKFGTVGAVALDKKGNLAAATSTGGMTNKRYGRIGDSPIIGAGTYANNETCAVSATGHGEYFIRNMVTHDISARMMYQSDELQKAASDVLKKVEKMGGSGGVIAISKDGEIAMPFTTEGMYRGYILEDGQSVINFYKEN